MKKCGNGAALRHVWSSALLLMAIITCGALPAWAQDSDVAEEAEEVAAEAELATEEAPVDDFEPIYAEDELDDIVAPIALYPDTLLTQILVASTYPLDVIKADRWVADNADLPSEDRTAALEVEPWDPSLMVLAAGFPTVIQRMAEDIEWTETLGDAVLVQSDDVLDAVQRQRARADVIGNLESNEAQTVTTEGDEISIAPTDPEVVYVPTYDPNAVYNTPPPATATQPTTTTVVEDDDGYSGGELVATGLLAFGAGMVVNEVFSDDDDDWDDYWYGPPRVDWDDGNFYPRPGRGGINVDGDVNIDIDRGPNVDLENVAWAPDRSRQVEAKKNISARKNTTNRVSGDRVGGDRATRPARAERDPQRAALASKLEARSGGGAKLSKPASAVAPKAKARASASDRSTITQRKGDLASNRKATSRAKSSVRDTEIKRRAAAPKASKRLAKPKTAVSPKRKASGKRSALNKRGGGKHAKASSARGAKSRGKRGKRRRG